MTSDSNKVPAVTLAFWVMKICATTLGETAGDLLSMTMRIGYAASSIILLSVFVAALTAQLRARSFHPVLYWLVILATSTAGTTMSDYMDRSLGLGYVVGSGILIVALVSVLLTWKAVTGSLSVSEIRSIRVEAFYWAAILISNTLGTAFGDFLADSSGLGFAGGAAVVSAAIAAIAAAYYFTSLSRTALFWAAFVLTRPLGATAGDLLTKPASAGGLDLGTVGSSLVLFSILVLLVAVSYRPARSQAS